MEHILSRSAKPTGILYNKDKIQKVLGVDHIDSWSALFDPETVQKLSTCGVSLKDTPDDVYASVLHFMGRDANSSNIKDYEEALALLQKIRPHVTYFNSSKFVTDMANGDTCIATANSGDGMQAIMRAKEAGTGRRIEYVVPEEGGNLWIDVLAIPADAKHQDEAYAFLNFMLAPENIAKVSNYTGFANANVKAKPSVSPTLRENPAVYPDPSMLDRLYVLKEVDRNVLRWTTRSWSTLKGGK